MLLDNIKRILLPILSIFLSYRTYDLLRGLVGTDPSEFTSSEIAIIAFLLTLFITGVFAFIGFAYSTSSLLPERYFKIKNPVFLNNLYRWFGIKYFKTTLLLLFWGVKKNRKKYFNGTKAGIKNFIFQTKQSEFGHLISLLCILLISTFLLYYGYYQLFIFANAINIIGNLYPVILQRHHRVRIEKIIK